MPEDESLNRVEPRGPALARVNVLGSLAVLAQRTHDAGELAVVRDERPRITGRTEVLAGIEAEGRGCPTRARADTAALRPMRLAGILEEEQPVLARERAKCAHIAELSIEVHWHERARAVADRRRRRDGVEAVVVLRDVRDDRHAAGLRHRLERRDKCRSRDDHFVTRLKSARDQREAQRVEPARDADALSDAAVFGERRLKRRHLRPVRERARVEEVGYLVEQPRLQRRLRGCEVEKRHSDAGPREIDCHAVTVDRLMQAHYRPIVQLPTTAPHARMRRVATEKRVPAASSSDLRSGVALSRMRADNLNP